MSSYAVLWQDRGRKPMPGRLEFDPDGLSLYGGNQERQVTVEIPYDEIIEATRDRQAHIGPCQAIQLTTRAAGPLLASLGGAAVLSEILQALQDALP